MPLPRSRYTIGDVQRFSLWPSRRHLNVARSLALNAILALCVLCHTWSDVILTVGWTVSTLKSRVAVD